jgi:hypothetical protein
MVLGTLKLSPAVWEVLHNISFWLHFGIVTALLYYLPFSRFFHVIMSPVIVAYNTLVGQEAHNRHRQASHEAVQAAVQEGSSHGH